jgi:hypothetical protein
MVCETSADAIKQSFVAPKTARRVRGFNVAGIFFRSAFIIAFGLGALWASLPADRDISAIPGLPAADLVRVGLGVVVCLGALIQTFNLPKDDQAYRTWTYIGVACTITLLCVIAVHAVLQLL